MKYGNTGMQYNTVSAIQSFLRHARGLNCVKIIGFMDWQDTVQMKMKLMLTIIQGIKMS